jgi:hypothetical protein
MPSRRASTRKWAEMRAGFAASDGKLEGRKAEILRWMFLCWVGSLGTVLAILKL